MLLWCWNPHHQGWVSLREEFHSHPKGHENACSFSICALCEAGYVVSSSTKYRMATEERGSIRVNPAAFSYPNSWEVWKNVKKDISF
jgi:hypothetical protein